MGVAVGINELIDALGDNFIFREDYTKDGVYALCPFKVDSQIMREFDMIALRERLSCDTYKGCKNSNPVIFGRIKPIYTKVDIRGYAKKSCIYYWDHLRESAVIDSNYQHYGAFDKPSETMRAINGGLLFIRKFGATKSSKRTITRSVAQANSNYICDLMRVLPARLHEATRLWARSPYLAYALMRGSELTLKPDFTPFVKTNAIRTKSLRSLFRMFSEIHNNKSAPVIFY